MEPRSLTRNGRGVTASALPSEAGAAEGSEVYDIVLLLCCWTNYSTRLRKNGRCKTVRVSEALKFLVDLSLPRIYPQPLTGERRQDYRATPFCSFWPRQDSMDLQRMPHSGPRRNSNLRAGRRCPTHCRDCRARCRSGNICRRCREVDSLPRGQTRLCRWADCQAEQEFQWAMLARRAVRSLAGLQAEQHIARRADACDPCW